MLASPGRPLEQLARIKDDMFPANAGLTGPSRLEQLAIIKDDMFPANARLTGPSRLEELRRIKKTCSHKVSASPSRQARLRWMLTRSWPWLAAMPL